MAKAEIRNLQQVVIVVSVPRSLMLRARLGLLLIRLGARIATLNYEQKERAHG